MTSPRASSDFVRRARPLLGTLVEIAVEEGPEAMGVIDAAFARIQRVQDLMSAHAAESDVGRIAREAHLQPVRVSAETAEVLRLALAIAEQTGGAFDPVAAAVRLIHGGRRPLLTEHPPEPVATWRDLVLEGETVGARCPLAVDLGGVAKGHAVDLAAAGIEAAGLSGTVNAGGDLRFCGAVSRTVLVRRPEAPDTFFELANLPARAVATSGAYGSMDETGACDLVDPRSSSAVAEVSVSVFADHCAVADALTKVVLNLPAEAAAEILSHHRASALVLTAAGAVHELP